MHLEGKEGTSDSIPAVQKSKEVVVAPNLFMDPRLPYNMERVVVTLLSTMIAKGVISVDEAKKIMKSGESYLH
jgi:hypothetical protein